MAKGGDFSIEVRDPYPCWCVVTYKGVRIADFTHKELSDLEYAVKKAIQEAKFKLGKDAGEV